MSKFKKERKNSRTLNLHCPSVKKDRVNNFFLERLECSFARQEAKLDKILSLMSSTTAQQQTPQYCSRPQFLIPDPHPSRSFEYPVQVPSVQRNADFTMQLPPVQRTPVQRTPLPDVDTLLQDAELTGDLLHTIKSSLVCF